MENQKRLIDADALKSEFEWLKSVVNESSKDEVQDTIQRIENAPTVDAVEVVRCRDCDWNDRDGRCMNPKCGKSWYGCPVPNKHYCSYGERR